MAATERRMGLTITQFLLAFLVSFDIVKSFNVDVKSPYIHTNPEGSAETFFGYSIAMHKEMER